jgi:hydrogenase maturation protease
VTTAAAPAPAAGVLVVGYGNPLRRDDGVGPAVVERLLADPRLAGADLRAEHQLNPELAPDVSAASLVVLVDAGAGLAPGCVAVRWLGVPAGSGAASGGPSFTHSLGPEALAGLAQAVWQRTPPIAVVEVGVASLGMGEGLTPEVAAAVPRVVEIVAAIIDERRHA